MFLCLFVKIMAVIADSLWSVFILVLCKVLTLNRYVDITYWYKFSIKYQLHTKRGQQLETWINETFLNPTSKPRRDSINV